MRPPGLRTVGELLWLPSPSTPPSVWLGRLGFTREVPVEALVQGGIIREGERSPPGTMENWYEPDEAP